MRRKWIDEGDLSEAERDEFDRLTRETGLAEEIDLGEGDAPRGD